MKSIRQTVGQALVRYLAAQYSERDGQTQRLIAGVWAILGHGNVAGLGQALEELGDQAGLPTYRPQNEQAMVHAAAAYAKHMDRLATFACTASVGPGSTNMITGAAGATVNRLPVLLLPSDIFANRRPDPVLQQLEHPGEHDVSVNDAFRSVSRFYTRISRAEQLLAALPEAMRVLTDPAETGAVTISLPEDVQAEAFDWPPEFFQRRVWLVRRPPPEPERIGELAELLRRATRPLMIAGGGAIYSGAGEELDNLSRAYGIPVVETQAGKGALAWNHPLNAGPVGVNGGSAANALARDADLVLAIGTRLSDFTTASMTAFQHPAVRFAAINVSPFDAGKLAALAVVADARSGLAALAQALTGHPGTSAAYRERVADLKRQWDGRVDALRSVGPEPVSAARFSQAEVIGTVNELVGGRATVICAAGSMPGDLLKLWRPEDRKAYHLEYGFSCMGYEIPAALGVKLAEPGREVVVFIGDGSYLMMNSEIVTALAEGLAFTVVLVDNHGYQSINGLQRSLGTPSFVNELRFRNATTGRTTGPTVAVDYLKHAEAMGALALRADDRPALQAALARAKAAGRVSVIVVETDVERRVEGFAAWWDVPVAEVSEQAGVVAARGDYQEQARRQRELRAGPAGREEGNG